MADNISRGADNSSLSELNVHPILKSTYLLACCWVFIAHGVIVLCFAANRTRQWTNYSKQILSLSLNDLSVGIACLILLVEFSFGEHTPYNVCAVSYYFYFAALCANLYHVFAICIHRAILLIKRPTAAEPTSVRLTVILVMMAWIPAFCLCAAVWGEERTEVPVCKVERVLGNQLDTTMGFLATGYVIPLLFTNIVYCITCYKLKLVWRKTFPAPTTNSVVPTTTEPVSSNTRPGVHAQTVIEPVTNSTRPGVRAQKRAIVTIGMLLLFFNIFSVPYVVVMVVMFSGTRVDRNLRVLMSIVFIMNSVTSPFVYAIRTKYLGQALKDVFKEFYRCVRVFGQERN